MITIIFMQVFTLCTSASLTPCTCPKPFPIMQNRKAMNQHGKPGLRVIDKWEMFFMKSIWSKLVIIDWICGINSWFLLGFALVFVYVWSWDAIIGGKNPCSHCRNYFHCNTCSDYSACNPWPWWTSRYVHCTLTCVCAPFLGLFFASKASKKFFTLFLNCKGIVNVI